MRKSPFQPQVSGIYKLGDKYQNHQIFNFSCSRYGLDFFLSKYSQDGDIIYFPNFICRDFLAPAHKHKLTIKFYSVSKDLICDLSIIKNCKFIVMVNYFGFPADLKSFEAVAEEKNALIIEDNAHGFLSKDENNNELGSRTGVGLISIRKTIDLKDAAILLLEKNKFRDLKPNITFYTKDNFKIKVKKTIKSYLNFFPIVVGMYLLRTLQIIRKLKTGNIYPIDSEEAEYNLPSNYHVNHGLKKQIIPICHKSEVNYRRASFEKIKKIAAEFDIEAINNNYTKYTSPYCFAFIAPQNKKIMKQFESKLFKFGFFILPWPSLPSTFEVNIENKWMANVKIIPFNW